MHIWSLKNQPQTPVDKAKRVVGAFWRLRRDCQSVHYRNTRAPSKREKCSLGAPPSWIPWLLHGSYYSILSSWFLAAWPFPNMEQYTKWRLITKWWHSCDLKAWLFLRSQMYSAEPLATTLACADNNTNIIHYFINQMLKKPPFLVFRRIFWEIDTCFNESVILSIRC